MKPRKALPWLTALLLLVPAIACSSGAKATADKEKVAAATSEQVKNMSVDQLAELQKAGTVAVFDANGDDYRKENGIIPGAVLLPHSAKYDLSLLPSDKNKKLVFYCVSRL